MSESWQQVVRGYLRRRFETFLQLYEAKRNDAAAEFLRDSGSELIARLYLENANKSLNELGSSFEQHTWHVIEESDRRVLVEIPVDEETPNRLRRTPFESTRLLLFKPRDDWKLHDILHRCIGCNLPGRKTRRRKEGLCNFCSGKGDVLFMESEPCQYCDGTGECVRCRAETMKGWQRAYFLNT